jgi:hypothetical protein
MTSAASIFESFNARALNPRQVAATFVPSQQFRRLGKRCHTVVLGPRGSGKTTLLKMLQTSALENWKHPEASNYIDGIDFTGVFVATDIGWGEQLASLGCGQLDEPSRRVFSIASFTTHILRSLVSAMQSRTAPDSLGIRAVRRVENNPQKESKIVRELVNIWHLHDVIPNFEGVRLALSKRLASVRELANKEALLGSDGRQERLAGIAHLHIDFLQAAALGVEVYDDLLGKRGDRWGMLFDELEIAPTWIYEQLIRSMRSTDERFLFKLALNPFNVSGQELLSIASAPAPGQDFDQLALWYAEKKDAYRFCRDLWGEMLRDRMLPATVARDVLGKSEFETDREEWTIQGTAYRRGSRWHRRFRSLERKDSGFRAYLDSRGINLGNLETLSGTERATELRKIAPVVAARDFFLQDPEDAKMRMRSRKSRSLYAGAESLFAISEGNPRWFIGLIKGLLDDNSITWTTEITPKISAGRQATEVKKVAQRFAATLRTIPVPASTDGTRPLDVLGLVRKVGRYFHAQAIKGDFRPEPAGSFVVDSKTPDSVLAVLAQALNAGAIVYVPDDDGQLILASLRGKRFRASYLLAPLYDFPIRLGKHVALSSILNADDVQTQKREQMRFEADDEMPS